MNGTQRHVSASRQAAEGAHTRVLTLPPLAEGVSGDGGAGGGWASDTNAESVASPSVGEYRTRLERSL